jgi:hypothetical protein
LAASRPQQWRQTPEELTSSGPKNILVELGGGIGILDWRAAAVPNTEVDSNTKGVTVARLNNTGACQPANEARKAKAHSSDDAVCGFGGVRGQLLERKCPDASLGRA